ncbi:MAG: biotin/lipoyl-containing protein [Brevefilum sp.]|nr:biotin/lipoyl-containing protein [Brevefilum sp.]
MTLYTVSVGTKKYQVAVSDQAVEINGQSTHAALVKVDGQGLYQLDKDNQKQDILIQALGKGQYSLNVAGRQSIVTVEKTSSQSQRKVNKHVEGDIKAPISGVVVKVNVVVGDRVSTEDVVLVLESMKMQMLIRAPLDGIVTAVHVTSGTQLAKGDSIVTIE